MNGSVDNGMTPHILVDAAVLKECGCSRPGSAEGQSHPQHRPRGRQRDLEMRNEVAHVSVRGFPDMNANRCMVPIDAVLAIYCQGKRPGDDVRARR